MNFAIGLLETKGFTASVEAADTMLKTTGVKLAGREKLTGDYVTIIVTGTLEQVRMAVSSGAAAALKVGELVAAHVIPEPHKDLSIILPLLLEPNQPISADNFMAAAEPEKPAVKEELLKEKTQTTVETPSIEPPLIKTVKKINKKNGRAKTIFSPEQTASSGSQETAGAEPEIEKSAILQEEAKGREENLVEEKTGSDNIEAEQIAAEVKEETKPAAAVKEKKKTNRAPGRKKSAENPVVSPVLSLFDHDYHNETIERLKREALGIKSTHAPKVKNDYVTETAEVTDAAEEKAAAKVDVVNIGVNLEELGKLNVHQLRKAARDYENFPIKGRQISKANRDVLLDYFKRL